MDRAVGSWWRARVPRLLTGTAIGLFGGSVNAAAWVFAWQSEGEGPQFYRVSPLGILSPREILLGCAVRVMGYMILGALVGLLSRPADRTGLFYLSVISLRQKAGRALRRAVRPRSTLLD